jgi:IclR family KDG regulon transcriptional repressor
MTQRSIKSAERTLRLFELFSRHQERLTVTDVARGLAIPQPSASMLLTNLSGLGYLEYDRFDRSYAPTIRVVLLGSWIGPRLGGRESLASRLDDLHRSVGEDIFVGIQNDARVQIVQARSRVRWQNLPAVRHHRAWGVEPGAHDLSIDSGQKFSLIRTAIGRVLLMSKPDVELARLVRRCNAEAESRHRVDEVAFMAIIKEVRRNGYAVTSGHFSPGRSSIAVPVAPRTDRVPFGIGIAGPIDRIEAKRELILQGLRAFQRAALESDFINNSDLSSRRDRRADMCTRAADDLQGRPAAIKARVAIAAPCIEP